jgi:hypothetical protein
LRGREAGGNRPFAQLSNSVGAKLIEHNAERCRRLRPSPIDARFLNVFVRVLSRLMRQIRLLARDVSISPGDVLRLARVPFCDAVGLQFRISNHASNRFNQGAFDLMPNPPDAVGVNPG